MTDNELKELVAGLAVSQAKTDKELDKLFDRVSLAQAKTDLQIKETSESIKRVSENVGSITNNAGSITEEYFFNSMRAKPYLGGVKYDFVDRNIKGNVPKARDEFDIVMYNGDSIALVECKSKAHKSDLIKLIDKKAYNFKVMFPDYKDYKIYLGLASFSFYDELEEMAKENGVAILKQKGDVVEIEADNLKVY